MAMGVFWVVSNPPALPLRFEKEVQEFTTAMTIFIECLLSVLFDQLCDVYMNIKSATELWEALEHKFGATDAGHELYVMEKYHDFKMVENRSVMKQAHEFQLIVRELEQLGHALPDKFVAGGIICQVASILEELCHISKI
jgi:transcription elongation factor GreA-like protein